MVMSYDALHIAARRVLLDALEATATYRKSLIIVGAQAVYLRTESATLTLTPFTTDGDIAVDPRSLPTAPALESILISANFTKGEQPGTWARQVGVSGRQISVDIDFLVPEAVVSQGGRRSVVLEGHDRNATRRVYGLEAALIDHSPLRIQAHEPEDNREITVEVAGAAALFIAKIHKIAERVKARRQERTSVDKDAGDIYRLIQVTSVTEMALGLRLALDSQIAHQVARRAIERLDELFGRAAAPGVAMAVRAIGVSGEAPETISAVLTGYASNLQTRIAAAIN